MDRMAEMDTMDGSDAARSARTASAPGFASRKAPT